MPVCVHPIQYTDLMHVFDVFCHDRGTVFLDSALSSVDWGRYSYIAVAPWQQLVAKNKRITLNHQTWDGNPFDVLKEHMARFQETTRPDMPPFQGGVAGFFGYDLYQHLENIPRPAHDDLQFPDCVLGFYDLVFAFDHQQRKAWLISSGFPEQSTEARARRAQERLTWALECLVSVPHRSTIAYTHHLPVMDAYFDASTYLQAVQQVIDYIYSGDIYQANMTRRLQCVRPETFDPALFYKHLRQVNPAPFAGYMAYEDFVIASASPERFIQLQEGRLETKPIKGTRRRSPDPQEDARIAAELCASEKDRAENIMIMDLLRNDFSRVCQPHSVHVDQLLALESYATVHHLVTTIQGRLKDGLNAVDVLKATFPGGSITGAPKIRAMEIISELEPNQRGPYCGSMGYIGFDGAMDTNIMIRTIVMTPQLITFQVGGGIVSDSDPQDEYDETEVKAAALRHALMGSEGASV